MALAFLLLLVPLAAEDAKPLVTRIEYRFTAPGLSEDSFAAKSKVLYIGDVTYSRLEEQPDPKQGIHGLIVTAEPDAWLINLQTHTGKHIVDPGPTYVTHHNILDYDAPKVYHSFEFGKEMQFFEEQHVAPKAQDLEGVACEVFEFKQEGYRLVLFARADTHKPFHLDVFKGDKLSWSTRYISYETGLKFDPALFKPPAGVKFEEANPHEGSIDEK